MKKKTSKQIFAYPDIRTCYEATRIKLYLCRNREAHPSVEQTREYINKYPLNVVFQFSQEWTI